MEGHRYIKEAVRTQMELDLPGNVTMDAPDLSYEDLTALAQNRQAWKNSMPRQIAGTKTQRSVPATTKTPAQHKLKILLQATTATNTEQNAVKKAWEQVFGKDSKAKNKQRSKKCKKKKQKINWTNKQRAEWARAHFERNHGKTDHDATTKNIYLKNNCNKLWDEQAKAPAGVTNTHRQQQQQNEQWETSTTQALFDESTEHSSTTSNTLWMAPAELPTYSTADETPTTPTTTPTTDRHALWTAPADMTPSALTQTPTEQQTEKYILGHRNNKHIQNNKTHDTPLTFPPLSPITTTLHTNMNDTYIHTTTNKTFEHIRTILTPLHNTYILHPNPKLYD